MRSNILSQAERTVRASLHRVRDGLGAVRASGAGRATAPAPNLAGPIYDADDDTVISPCITEVDFTDSGACTAPSFTS